VNKSNRVAGRKKVCDHYATDQGLGIRIKTHEEYTVPRVNFPEWVLDRIDWLGNETVLDVGCGPGNYALPAKDRGCRYIAADLSLGMLQNLVDGGTERVNMDALSIPFRNNTIDVILANHMLYHVPALATALLEFRRVLKPGGRLVAATNSDSFMHQIDEVVDDASRSLGGDHLRDPARKGFIWPFSVENGRDQLKAVFDQVLLHELHSELVFPAAEPVVTYIDSTADLYQPHLKNGVRWQAVLLEVEQRVEKQIISQGTFRVNKHNGIFVCRN